MVEVVIQLVDNLLVVFDPLPVLILLFGVGPLLPMAHEIMRVRYFVFETIN